MTWRPESILATDVGSTTTKAVLIERRGDGYRLVARGEMPTTVEAPWENVMIGVRNSIRRVEELTERPILDESGTIRRPSCDGAGVDVYVSTSSAGGGLQMMVAGLVLGISASSAHRAALGAGAVVLDVIAVDDGRSQSEQITRITELRPDIILMSGGVDGGSISYLASTAEIIHQANPQPRFGSTFRLPLVYAGNKDAADLVADICGRKMDVHAVPNLRPRHDVEHLGPARNAIHDLFMNHVMAQAPGYGELMDWVDASIMPTPGAVGSMVDLAARTNGFSVIGVDIGGATTDVFSSFEGTFTRTVSANLGMSYSVCNVQEEAGFDNIMRWVPFAVDREEMADLTANKMVRPTTIPQTLYQLVVEQALAREALRLSFAHHKELAKKVETQEVGVFRRNDPGLGKSSGRDVIDMTRLGMLIGSGGVLSHAPRRQQAALMLLDAFQPIGVTRLAVDSIFMMPHLGVLSSVFPDIAAEVFEKDCLVPLGTAIAPVGSVKPGAAMATVKIDAPGVPRQSTVVYGEISVIKLPKEREVDCVIEPVRGCDIGAGKGRPLNLRVRGGLVGLILDGRGRPIDLPEDDEARVAALSRWISSMDAYPAENLGRIQASRPVQRKATGGGKKRGW
ncbi:MAG: glutamate mutase L [Bacillota bacterium]